LEEDKAAEKVDGKNFFFTFPLSLCQKFSMEEKKLINYIIIVAFKSIPFDHQAGSFWLGNIYLGKIMFAFHLILPQIFLHLERGQKK
jgi:hypothetical protein